MLHWRNGKRGTLKTYFFGFPVQVWGGVFPVQVQILSPVLVVRTGVQRGLINPFRQISGFGRDRYPGRLFTIHYMTLNHTRILSSIVVAMAYLVTLYHNDIVGSRMYIIGNSLAMPYMIQNKLWDMVTLLSFFIVFGVPKAIGGY